jgi:hypothetical protein
MKAKTPPISTFLGSFSGLYYPYRMAVFWSLTKSLWSRLWFGPGSSWFGKIQLKHEPQTRSSKVALRSAIRPAKDPKKIEKYPLPTRAERRLVDGFIGGQEGPI